jgi:hypothetical protein
MVLSGQKLTLDLLATITLEVVPFRAYAPFPPILPFLNCILEVVFCDDVQHRIRFCPQHLNCVNMAAFQFYLQSGKQKKVGGVGDDNHVALGQKFHDEKGCVRRCVVVMQQPVLLSPNFGAKSSQIFTQSR